MMWHRLTEIERALTNVPVHAKFSALATYNAERARGIMHTAEWDAKMADLQREWKATLGRGHPA
jgi:hypothetical protein